LGNLKVKIYNCLNFKNMAKKYTVEFTRNAVYQERGYIIIEASTKAEARQLAKEALENGEDVMDYEGDVSDLDFVNEQLDDNHTRIDNIEVDDFIEDDGAEEEEDYSDYDEEEEEY